MRYDIPAVLAATDLVTLAGEHTELKRAGRQYKGRCPFHDERTGSFMVDPVKQKWYCHGACHTGGNAIAFLVAAGRKPGEAIRELAERAGVAPTGEVQPWKSPAQRKETTDTTEKAEVFWRLVRHDLTRAWIRCSRDLRDIHDETGPLAELVRSILRPEWRRLNQAIEAIQRANRAAKVKAYAGMPEWQKRKARQRIREQQQIETAFTKAIHDQAVGRDEGAINQQLRDALTRAFGG